MNHPFGFMDQPDKAWGPKKGERARKKKRKKVSVIPPRDKGTRRWGLCQKGRTRPRSGRGKVVGKKDTERKKN